MTPNLGLAPFGNWLGRDPLLLLPPGDDVFTFVVPPSRSRWGRGTVGWSPDLEPTPDDRYEGVMDFGLTERCGQGISTSCQNDDSVNSGKRFPQRCEGHLEGPPYRSEGTSVKRRKTIRWTS